MGPDRPAAPPGNLSLLGTAVMAGMLTIILLLPGVTGKASPCTSTDISSSTPDLPAVCVTAPAAQPRKQTGLTSKQQKDGIHHNSLPQVTFLCVWESRNFTHQFPPEPGTAADTHALFKPTSALLSTALTPAAADGWNPRAQGRRGAAQEGTCSSGPPHSQASRWGSCCLQGGEKHQLHTPAMGHQSSRVSTTAQH